MQYAMEALDDATLWPYILNAHYRTRKEKVLAKPVEHEASDRRHNRVITLFGHSTAGPLMVVDELRYGRPMILERSS